MFKRTSMMVPFVFVLGLFSLAFAGLEYANVMAFGTSVTCCSFGQDCPQGKGREPILRCCSPGVLEAPCSQDKQYYCRECG